MSFGQTKPTSAFLGFFRCASSTTKVQQDSHINNSRRGALRRGVRREGASRTRCLPGESPREHRTASRLPAADRSAPASTSHSASGKGANLCQYIAQTCTLGCTDASKVLNIRLSVVANLYMRESAGVCVCARAHLRCGVSAQSKQRAATAARWFTPPHR